MHISKLITGLIVAAAAGVLASPSSREQHTHLSNADAGFGGVHDGNEAVTAAFDSGDQGFSEIPMEDSETSLEAAARRRCYLGRCLGRITFRRRCPRGYHAVAYRHCGFWSIRAVCCRHRRYGRHYFTGLEDAVGVPGQVDELDE